LLKLLGGLPAGTSIMLSILPTGMKYRHPGVDLAIAERSRCYGSVSLCPIKPLVGLRYMVGADVIVYASATKHHEPYGRMVVEAMALGKPVICERKGIFGNMLEHGVNALLYDNVGEVLDYIDRIRSDTKTAQKLGTNAQLWASWQDTTVHIGKLKRILRTIGI
jgi:glycosyltransferase involved in cell wall biosynthesis